MIGLFAVAGIAILGFMVSMVIETVYGCQRKNAEAQMENYEKQVLFHAQQQKAVAGRMAEYGSNMRNPLQARNRIVRPRADEDAFSIEDDSIPNIGGANRNGESL